MPPKKPTTRKSLRAPRLKEPEVGEGSSLVIARQLEFDPMLVPIIKTTSKKAFIQPLAFGDPKVNIGTKTVFPCWEEIFKKIKREEFPEYTLHNDPNMQRLNDEVLPNV
jgi:hypothetical protein